MRRVSMLLLTLLLLPGTGCAPRSDSGARALTQRERDSVLARSRIPGATVVGRALSDMDREAQRAAGVDAAVDSLFP